MINITEHHYTAMNERKLPYEVLATIYPELAPHKALPTEEEFDAVFCSSSLSYDLTNDKYAHLEHPDTKLDGSYYDEHQIENVSYMGAHDFVEQYQVHVEKAHFILLDDIAAVIRKVDGEYHSFIYRTPDLDFMIAPAIRNAIVLMKLIAYKNNKPSQYSELIQKYIDYSKTLL